MHRLSLLLALLSGTAGAQALDVTEGTRTAEVQAFGFDYDFDDGLQQKDFNFELQGPWSADLVGDLDDYYGFDVADARATQVSGVAPTLLECDLDAVTSAAGNHFLADSAAETGYSVQFEAHEQVRYRFAADAETVPGYNEARVSLTREGVALADLDVSYQGGGDSVLQVGWLPVGEYVLDAFASSMAFGSSGQPGSAQAAVEARLEVFHAADYDLDGAVTLFDVYAFVDDILAGDLATDFDGDGVLTLLDWFGFRDAWLGA